MSLDTEAYQAATPLKEWLAAEKLLQQLSYPPALTLNAPELSLLDLEQWPKDGLVAIKAPKGTGKTKAIGLLVQHEDKVLVATHRVALGRGLCNRIGVDWRTDLDKVKGDFIDGAGYTSRVGFCVDSLLAIDPAKFAGCVLVIDEVVQVVRHLLTSSTCQKDGKRPVLLARLRELIQAARLVLVADADLDNQTLDYLQNLRGDQQPVFLVRNDYQAQGYPCTFMLAPNASPAIAQLLQIFTNFGR